MTQLMVTSAAVPAVVGTATTGTDGFLVSATPSRERTSQNSGLAVMIPIALQVSGGEPPLMATSQSDPPRRTPRPACTASIVGFGITAS
jgi:hypothetical protein